MPSAMHVVLDTNTVISGLLWHGPPRQILNLAREGKLTLFASSAMLAELGNVLQREKFAERLNIAGVMAAELVQGYAALTIRVEPATIYPVVADDPDDDVFLACAIRAGAQLIISGDRHLLDLEAYQQIPIVSASNFLAHYNQKEADD